ncbi:MAG: glycoside hydrolase family 5 protein [Chloroflexi bacterium]|nr:MAG: glycoside hydrolase family 5 protein [Chloroflexota bacterium]
MLQVNGSQVVTASSQPIYLRGVCVGGWMNMEEFINGYPGSEHGVRASMARKFGAETAQFFFDRMLDYVFAEDDVSYLKSLGCTVVRLPLNYRHFETDMKPFEYLESGFARLDQALSWCEKHGLYVILDMHAVPGWQNTDWHSDNSTRHTLFWQQVHFQDRFVALWEEFARRYKGRAVIAGYNVMNEPVTNAPYGRFSNQYEPDWDVINRIYRRVTAAIRAIDPDHIIFLEGDFFSSQFDGLEPPFAPNLVYSSHNYSIGGFGPGPYPGMIRGEQWDYQKQEQIFLSHSGTRFAQKHNVPLWVGEFGAAYNGPAQEIPDRLRALDDQLAIFNKHGAHWTMWTYKDIHVMGWVQPAPDAPYVQAIRHILDAKRELATDFWMGWIAPTPVKEKVFELADMIEKTLEDETVDTKSNRNYLSQAALSGYTAGLMQPLYARSFEGMSQTRLDQVLQSFAFKQCRPHAGLIEVIRKHLK